MKLRLLIEHHHVWRPVVDFDAEWIENVKDHARSLCTIASAERGDCKAKIINPDPRAHERGESVTLWTWSTT